MTGGARPVPVPVLGLVLALTACTRPPPVAPARAQVRTDIAARALARARAQYEGACSPLHGCERNVPPWLALEASLSDAELWLDAAQRAGDAWAAGDGRNYALIQPCFAAQLAAVADAQRAADQSETPGLRAAIEGAGTCELPAVPQVP